MLHSFASSTARLDGAPTAATTFIPAIDAFCISSKLALPLNSSTVLARGNSSLSKDAPITLSSALCRAHIFTEHDIVSLHVK